jgi:hypothetical protein
VYTDFGADFFADVEGRTDLFHLLFGTQWPKTEGEYYVYDWYEIDTAP